MKALFHRAAEPTNPVLAEHLVLAPDSVVSLHLLAVESMRRRSRSLVRPVSVPRYRALSAASHVTEQAAVKVIRDAGLDTAAYPNLTADRNLGADREWFADAVELLEAERETLSGPDQSTVLELVSLDIALTALRRALAETEAADGEAA